MPGSSRDAGGHQSFGPILVDGATGYLGTHLVHRLVVEGFTVRALVHVGASRKDMEFLSSIGAQVYVGDLSSDDLTSAAIAFNGCSHAVHLIGSIAPRRGVGLDSLHIGQTDRFVRCAQNTSVHTVLMVTALGTRSDAESNYHKTKYLAEEVVRRSGLQYTILKPSLILGYILGTRDSKLVKRYRDLILNSPFVPLVAGGANMIQPLFIGDMVEAACLCISHRAKFEAVHNTELELGGPKALTLKEFVESFMDVLDVHKPVIALHPLAANGLAVMSELVQDVPTLSRDQVKLSTTDNICQVNAVRDVFGIEPVPIKIALESYNLNNFQ